MSRSLAVRSVLEEISLRPLRQFLKESIRSFSAPLMKFPMSWDRSAKGFADIRLNPETSKAWESFPLCFAMLRSNWAVSAEILILISFLAIMCT